mgnify:CR=1 FL=1
MAATVRYSTGAIMMHDQKGAPGNKTTVTTILTRADHGNSEDGVLGFSLQPGFDLADYEWLHDLLVRTVQNATRAFHRALGPFSR